MRPDPNALSELHSLLGEQKVTLELSDRNEYGHDWTKHLKTDASAVVFPRSTGDVVQLVEWARRHQVGLIPSGGRTGLSGAATATQGEVVVSFAKMNRILDFNEADLTVICEPGVVTETLQNFATEKGYYFPVDFASRGSSQVGGNIATNAGGIKVLRYGLMRPWVAEIEVVTGSGEVLTLGKSLVKNATGYDLRQLFVGSEGTLGFITRAHIYLTRQPQPPLVFLFAVPELAAVMQVYHAYKSKFPILAFEMFTDRALEIVMKHTHLSNPFSHTHPYYLVLELEGVHSEVETQASEIFEHALERGWISDGLLAQSPQQARDFWRLREDISEASAAYQPYKNDISVKISDVPKFLQEMNDILRKNYQDIDVVWFGHIGDGNLHINMLKPPALADQKFLERCHEVDKLMFAMIEKFGGSISAEHGVGLMKKPYLQHSRSAAEITIMKQIKTIFDPDGILNPGKIF